MDAVDRFQSLFSRLAPDSPMHLEAVYDEGIVFRDPFRLIHGRAALDRYFKALNHNLIECRFEYHEVHRFGDTAVLRWTMRLSLRRGPEAPITVGGTSWLRYNDLVTSHHDYFDGGALVYEHVPVLGWFVRRVKASM